MTKEAHQALVKVSKFILICSGDTYSTEIVTGPQLLERILVAMFGNPADAPADYMEDLRNGVGDPDDWHTDPNGLACHWALAVGETDQIDIYRLTHEMA